MRSFLTCSRYGLQLGFKVLRSTKNDFETPFQLTAWLLLFREFVTFMEQTIADNFILSFFWYNWYYLSCKKIISFTQVRSNHRRGSVKKGCFEKFCNIHRKTPVLESLFNKVVDLRPAILLKRDSNVDISLWILQNF